MPCRYAYKAQSYTIICDWQAYSGEIIAVSRPVLKQIRPNSELLWDRALAYAKKWASEVCISLFLCKFAESVQGCLCRLHVPHPLIIIYSITIWNF